MKKELFKELYTELENNYFLLFIELISNEDNLIAKEEDENYFTYLKDKIKNQS